MSEMAGMCAGGEEREVGGLYRVGPRRTKKWTVATSRPVRYDVSLVPGLLRPDNAALVEAGVQPAGSRRRLVVVERRVHQIYGAALSELFETQKVEHEFCVIEAHEQLKTMDTVLRVADAMDRFGVPRRREPVIAVGGGVLSDVVGLATSLYRRSTPYVRVPTSLIGMVDAGIGAKTGVNAGRHKNRLGSYHPAVVTLLDPGFIRTLDTRHISNGLAEILKIALVKDAALFQLLADHGRRLIAERFQSASSADGGAVAAEVLDRAIEGMLSELQPNLWEEGLQRVVDYGHSFSPAIEMHALPELLHGEAVALDMVLTTALARRRGLLGGDQERRIRDVVRDLGLPVWHEVCTAELLAKALDETEQHRDGLQRVPLPDGIGSCVFVNDLTHAEVAAAADAVRQDQYALRASCARAAVPTGGSGG